MMQSSEDINIVLLRVCTVAKSFVLSFSRFAKKRLQLAPQPFENCQINRLLCYRFQCQGKRSSLRTAGTVFSECK